MLLEEG